MGAWMSAVNVQQSMSSRSAAVHAGECDAAARAAGWRAGPQMGAQMSALMVPKLWAAVKLPSMQAIAMQLRARAAAWRVKPWMGAQMSAVMVPRIWAA